MPTRSSSNITVLNRHAPSSLFQQKTLVSPDMGGCNVETQNSAFERCNASLQPLSQSCSRLAFPGSYPKRDLRNDYCAGVAVVLLPFEPFDNYSIPSWFCWLTENISIQQPAHNRILFAFSALRGGRSSIGTGHSFQTLSQLFLRLILRRITISSSGLKLASNWSPGDAGASAAGMLTRLLASSVTIMVGLSHHNQELSIESENRGAIRKFALT
jgi:hypothetical protein